jgi:hypothetical protein
MAIKYRTLRGASLIGPPPFSDFLAIALIHGYDILKGTSGLAADDRGNLDIDLARTAWKAHRDDVLAYAAANHPDRKVWAQQVFG